MKTDSNFFCKPILTQEQFLSNSLKWPTESNKHHIFPSRKRKYLGVIFIIQKKKNKKTDMELNTFEAQQLSSNFHQH